MKELTNAKRFASESPELYKLFKDYADQVVTIERNIQGKSFSALSLDAKEDAINKAFMEDIEKRAKVTLADYDGDVMHFAQNPLVKSFADATRDKMIDMILPEILNSSIGLVAEISYVDWGDVAKFDLDNNGLYNVSEAGWRQKNTTFQQLEGQTVTLAPTPRQISVRETLFEILTGRKSIAKSVMKAVKSIEAEMANEVWDAFATATSAVSVPNALKVQNYTQDSAITLAEIVTAYNGGNNILAE